MNPVRWLRLQRLRSPNPKARERAARGLLRARHPEAFRALAVACADPDAGVRAAAGHSLERICESLTKIKGGRAVRFLVRVVESGDPTGNRAALEPLINALRRVYLDDVIKDAVQALVVIDDPRAVTALIKNLGGSERRARVVADALAHFQTDEALDALITKLNDKYVRDVLIRIGARAARPSLFAQYFALDKYSSDREAALSVLEVVRPDWPVSNEASTALAETIDRANSSSNYSADAIRQFFWGLPQGTIPSDPAAIVMPSLLRAIESPSYRVRNFAAELLGHIKSSQAVEALAARLDVDKGSDFPQVTDALAKIGTPEAAAVLARGLGQWSAGEHCLRALKKLRWQPSNTQDKVMLLLASADYDGIGQMGKEALPAVLEALQSERYTLRTNAASAFERLRVPEAVPQLTAILAQADTKPSTRETVVNALAEIGMDAVQPLLVALSDASWDVRKSAARSLGKLQAQTAFDPLVALLKDPHWYPRTEAAEALGNLGNSTAVEPLVNCLREERETNFVRRSARCALDQLGWKPVTDSDRAFAAVAQNDWGTLRRLGKSALLALRLASSEKDSATSVGARDLSESHESSFVDQCILSGLSEEPDPRDEKSEYALEGLGYQSDVHDLESAVRRYSSLYLPYLWLSGRLRDSKEYSQAAGLLYEGLVNCKQKHDLCCSLGDIWKIHRDGRRALKWWIRSAVLQCESGAMDDYRPYMYLSYIAEELGMSDRARELIAATDRIRSIRLDSAARPEMMRLASQVGSDGSEAISELVRRYLR